MKKEIESQPKLSQVEEGILRAIGKGTLTTREIFAKIRDDSNLPPFLTFDDVRKTLARLKEQGLFQKESFALTDETKRTLEEPGFRSSIPEKPIELHDRMTTLSPRLERRQMSKQGPVRYPQGIEAPVEHTGDRHVSARIIAEPGKPRIERTGNRKFDHQVNDSLRDMREKNKDGLYLFTEDGNRLFLLSDGRVLTRFPNGTSSTVGMSDALIDYGRKKISVSLQIAIHRLGKNG